MVMRRKRVFVIILVMLFGAGLAMFLLTRDSGPPVVVQGNFSAKDVAEIKSVVKRELWHEAFPNLSGHMIKVFPYMVKRALSGHVVRIETPAAPGSGRWIGTPYGGSNLYFPPPVKAERAAYVFFGRSTDTFLIVTNGPGGWSFNRTILVPTL
jgi:hypothetical protein